jgi:uncharacterized protein
MIKISIRDITSKGLDIHRSIPKEGIGLSDEEIDLRSPIEVNAHLQRDGNLIVAETSIKADFGFMCARCLGDVHEVKEHHYHFDFEIDPTLDYVDVGEEIRQELILANPPRILCKDDCKGICPKCGKNLNVEPCKCSALP